MLYIDFDGVILDTEKLLFKEWRKNPNRNILSEIDKIKYIQNSDWKYILNNSEIINDALYYLKYIDQSKSFILTKIHSLTEGEAKNNWVNSKNIKQKVITVPYFLKKTDIVKAKGNILIDDSLRNLREWEISKGKPIFFDIDDDNYDSWNEPNVRGYEKVLSLNKFINYK